MSRQADSSTLAFINSEDRPKEYQRRLEKLSEADRFAVRCGFSPHMRDYQLARAELISRRLAAKAHGSFQA